MPARAADAWPAECKLQLEGSLPFTIAHGHVMIEASLGGVPRHFIVDTGAVFSSISVKTALDQNLPVHQLANLTLSGIGGEKLDKFVIADTLVLGHAKASHVRLVLAPSLSGEDGLLGPDYLRNFDLDFDFASRTLNLFAHHPCEDHVVYWGKPYIVLPLKITDDGGIRVPVKLDGKALLALVDTGSPGSLIGEGSAQSEFGIDAGAGDFAIRGAAGGSASGSEHRFQQLDLGGLALNNPTLVIAKGKSTSEFQGATMLLGLRELSKFHVYIAYREKKMYLSAQDPN